MKYGFSIKKIHKVTHNLLALDENITASSAMLLQSFLEDYIFWYVLSVCDSLVIFSFVTDLLVPVSFPNPWTLVKIAPG